MSWLTKWFPSGSESKNPLALKLRLTRWRHFLSAQKASLDWLADLREKLEEEYIFDRQYIHSTLGLVFQNAFQAAYDQGILFTNQETGMYDWLDQLQERAQVLLRNNGLNSSSPENGDEEPEYRIIRGILAVLDPAEDSRPAPPQFRSEENIDPLRKGLQQAHDHVLEKLFRTEDCHRWINKGLAKPLYQIGLTPLYLINLDEKMQGLKNEAHHRTESELLPSSAGPWIDFSKTLPLVPPSKAASEKTSDPRLFLLIEENSFFLTGVLANKRIFLDVVLTSIREINHFFLRVEGSGSGETIEFLTRLFDWTHTEGNRIREIALFNQTASEVERHLKILGQGLSAMIGRNN